MSTESPAQLRLLKPEEVIVLSQEIQAMISAGVPLDLGMRSAAAGFAPDLETAANNIADRLEQGATIAEAFGAEPSVPPVFRAILVAGLSCGQSEAVLRDVTRLTSMQIALRQSLRLGMVYPLLVIFLAVGLFGLIAATMLPQMAAIYEQLQIALPSWISIILNVHIEGYHFVVFLFLVVFAFYMLSRIGRTSPLAGLNWLPGISAVAKDFSTAHFSHLLSLLVKYGVPLPDALRLAGETSSQGRLRQDSFNLAEAVTQGQDLQTVVGQQVSFPPFLQWLLIAGQRDSDLGTTLKHAANFYQSRARSRAIWLSQVVPTAVVIVVGGSVTLLYTLSVFLPMVELWSKLATY